MGDILIFPIECTCNTIFTENLCRKCALEAKTRLLYKIKKKEEEIEELEDQLSDMESSLEEVNARIEELGILEV